MRRHSLLIFLALAIAGTGSAHAAWHRADSAHFVIYSDDRPDRLRDFAVRLEKFDRAVREVRGMADHPVGDGNRVTIFVLPNVDAVQKLSRSRVAGLHGFYSPRASGSVAFVPRRAGGGAKWELDADNVFFHEYSHHLMMQDLASPLPEWLIEGFAEFMSTAKFEPDGAVSLGSPALHRAYGLLRLTPLPLEQMLAGNYSRLGAEQRETVYGRGWLLTHFLTFEPKRRGQLDSYVSAIAKGTPPVDAARSAFGDLKALDREMSAYIRQKTLSYVRVAPERIRIAPIYVTPLTAGGAAIIRERIESKRGVNSRLAQALVQSVRRKAAPFPADPLAQVTLAEAEIDAGNLDEAEAAADRALAADPSSTEAMIFKGRAIMERAVKGMTGASFKDARKWFIAANQKDKEDPEPLALFYESYGRERVAPSLNAISALHYASNLAPQDRGLRLRSARQYLIDGKARESRTTLAPIAYDPHGRGLSEVARSIIALIDSGKAGAAREKLTSTPDDSPEEDEPEG